MKIPDYGHVCSILKDSFVLFSKGLHLSFRAKLIIRYTHPHALVSLAPLICHGDGKVVGACKQVKDKRDKREVVSVNTAQTPVL